MGRALVVGSASNRAGPVEILQRLYSFECVEADDPYAAVMELCRRKVVYNAVILSLASLYREELGVIATIKRRFPRLEVWLTHTDARQAALAEAMRLGADGLLGDDGLHRIAPIPAAAGESAPQFTPSADKSAELDTEAVAPADAEAAAEADAPSVDEPVIGEPVLSAEELRALLQDQPSLPPSNQSEE